MRAMSLAEALQYARAHQPEIRSALAQYAARRAEARVPRAEWLPQVGATAQLYEATANNSSAEYVGTPDVNIPRIGGTSAGTRSWTPSASSIVAASVQQEVYDFGRISAQIAVADALAEFGHASADALQLDVQLGVEESYAAVLASKHVLTSTNEALKRAVTHRDYAAAGVKSGLQPPVNLTRAQADVAQLQVRVIQAASGVQVARAALAASMASDSLQVDAQDSSTDVSAAPALEAVFDEAAKKNPAIVAALARLRAANAEVSATTRELLPNLSATAGLSGRAGGVKPTSAGVPYGDGWLPDVPNWYAGLVLQWNIFDGTVLARRDAAKARADAAQADLQTARMTVGLDVERAWLDLNATLEVMPGLQTAVDAARANMAQADARFRAGLGNIIELADAEAILINAELQLAVGQFSVDRARAVIGRAMGRAVFPLMTKTTQMGTK